MHTHTHTLVDTHTHPAGWFLIPYCHYGEGITAPPAVWLVICMHVWDDDVLCACFVLNRWTKTSCHLEWWIPERFPEDLISHLPLQILAGRWPEDEALRWVTHVYVHLKAATVKVTHVFHFYFLSRNNLSLCLIDNVLLLSVKMKSIVRICHNLPSHPGDKRIHYDTLGLSQHLQMFSGWFNTENLQYITPKYNATLFYHCQSQDLFD